MVCYALWMDAVVSHNIVVAAKICVQIVAWSDYEIDFPIILTDCCAANIEIISPIDTDKSIIFLESLVKLLRSIIYFSKLGIIFFCAYSVR